jgi:hypothetical protein
LGNDFPAWWDSSARELLLLAADNSLNPRRQVPVWWKGKILRSESMSRGSTKRTLLIAGLMTGLLLAIVSVPLNAQPAEEVHSQSEIAKVVTLNGTVSGVFAKPEEGMIAGSHLLLETGSGRVDASLGKWGLAGKGALSVDAGQEVEVTGVMKTIRDKQVLLVRTVKVGSQVYTIRNQHGVPVSPQSRERASRKDAQKGETL